MTKNGFTLIELLIYLAIFALVCVFAILATGDLFSLFGRIRSERRVAYAGEVAMERITREIRLATNIAGAGGDSSTLTLVTSCAGKPIEQVIQLTSDGQLEMSYSNACNATLILTPIGIIVSDLRFRVISQNASSILSRATSIEFTVRAGTGRYAVSRTFRSFGVLRGSY